MIKGIISEIVENVLEENVVEDEEEPLTVEMEFLRGIDELFKVGSDEEVSEGSIGSKTVEDNHSTKEQLKDRIKKGFELNDDEDNDEDDDENIDDVEDDDEDEDKNKDDDENDDGKDDDEFADKKVDSDNDNDDNNDNDGDDFQTEKNNDSEDVITATTQTETETDGHEEKEFSSPTVKVKTEQVDTPNVPSSVSQTDTTPISKKFYQRRQKQVARKGINVVTDEQMDELERKENSEKIKLKRKRHVIIESDEEEEVEDLIRNPNISEQNVDERKFDVEKPEKKRKIKSPKHKLGSIHFEGDIMDEIRKNRKTNSPKPKLHLSNVNYSEDEHRNWLRDYLISKGVSPKAFGRMKTSTMEDRAELLMLIDSETEKDRLRELQMQKEIEEKRFNEDMQRAMHESILSVTDMKKKDKGKVSEAGSSSHHHQQQQQTSSQQQQQQNSSQQQQQEQTEHDKYVELEERYRNRKSKIPAKILGWKYDEDTNKFLIKRAYGICQYFENMHDVFKLPKSDLMQLAKLDMINHGKYSAGRDFEIFLRSQARKDFKGFKTNSLMRSKAKESFDLEIKRRESIKKQVQSTSIGPILGWLYDSNSREVVIKRYQMSDYRIYEYSDLKKLGKEDVLQLSKYSMIGNQDDPEGKMFLKVFEEMRAQMLYPAPVRREHK